CVRGPEARERARDRDSREQHEEPRRGRRGPEDPGGEQAHATRRVPGAALRSAPRGLLVGDDDARDRSRVHERARAVLRRSESGVELDLAAQLPRERAPDRGYREQRQAVGYLWTRTTGTRTISSIDPSRGLRSKTSTLPSVSTRGSAYVAAIVNVPRSGAPALAVVIPSASGRPEVSTMRQ